METREAIDQNVEHEIPQWESGICAHCGLPTNLKGQSTSPQYCCYGCEIAHDVLGTAGEVSAGRLSKIRLGVGVVLGLNVMMFSMPLYVDSLGDMFRDGKNAADFYALLKWLLLGFATPVYLLLGRPFIASAFSIEHLRRPNTDVLIGIGVTAAFLLSVYNTVFTSGPVYYETAVGILVVVTLGRYLESKTRWKAWTRLQQLQAKVPREVTRIANDGYQLRVAIEGLIPGDTILVSPGEIIPVDGIVLHGQASIDEAQLTGESRPVVKSIGDEVLGGSTNFDGLLRLNVSRPASQSFLARMEDLLMKARLQKARVQEVAETVSEIAVPIVLLVAIASFVYWGYEVSFSKGLLTFLSVLLIACPCALGIATPAALWAAVSTFAKRGALFHSLTAVERLAAVKHVFFDKTGTLTTGEQVVVGVELERERLRESFGGDELSLLGAIHAIERGSRHPAGLAITRSFAAGAAYGHLVEEFRETAGEGVSARVGSRRFRIGRKGFAIEQSEALSDTRTQDNSLTSVWCSIDGEEEDGFQTVCVLKLQDARRPEAAPAVKQLRDLGLSTTILSGDASGPVDHLASELNCDWKAELRPQEKIEIVQASDHALFVGDGMNDAASIAVASVGMAMGTGSDISRAAADITLVHSDLSLVPELVLTSRRAMKIVRQNFVWAFGYNVVGVVAAAFGLLNPIIAALAMVLSSFAVVHNSMRIR